MSYNQNIHLTRKQEEERKKLLKKLKKEIKKLEYQVKHNKLANINISLKRIIRIIFELSKAAFPYVLTATVIAGLFKIIGLGFPYYSEDKVKKYSHIMKDMDSLGNIRIEQQYDKFEETTELLYYYTKWIKEENEFYSRNVEVYKLKDITEEDILKLFEKEDFKLSDIFGEPITNKKETSNNIKINEEENKDYLQAIIYIKDKNDYIIKKESVDDNVTASIIYSLITLILGLIISLKMSDSNYNLGGRLYDVDRNYPFIDKDEIIKKLEIKKNNYERLTR